MKLVIKEFFTNAVIADVQLLWYCLRVNKNRRKYASPGQNKYTKVSIFCNLLIYFSLVPSINQLHSQCTIYKINRAPI
jgi:hypothetical protein